MFYILARTTPLYRFFVQSNGRPPALSSIGLDKANVRFPPMRLNVHIGFMYTNLVELVL